MNLVDVKGFREAAKKQDHGFNHETCSTNNPYARGFNDALAEGWHRFRDLFPEHSSFKQPTNA